MPSGGAPLSTSSGSNASALLEQLDALDIAAACVDEDGRISAANKSFFSMTGADSGSVIDRGFNDFLEATAAEHSSYAEGAVYRFEHPRGDRWLRPRRARAQAGSIVTLTDVTGEWSMLGRLVAAIDVRDKLMRDSDVGMFRYDPDTQVFNFSEALVRRSGGAPSVATSKLDDIVSTLHPEDVDKDAAIRERITTQGGTATCSLRRRKPDGGWRHTLVHFCSGRRLASGKYEMFGLSQNITELVDARDHAAVMHERLEIAMSA